MDLATSRWALASPAVSTWMKEKKRGTWHGINTIHVCRRVKVRWDGSTVCSTIMYIRQRLLLGVDLGPCSQWTAAVVAQSQPAAEDQLLEDNVWIDSSIESSAVQCSTAHHTIAQTIERSPGCEWSRLQRAARNVSMTWYIPSASKWSRFQTRYNSQRCV